MILSNDRKSTNRVGWGFQRNGKKKVLSLLTVLTIFYVQPLFATYNIYLMNNTVDDIAIKDICDDRLSDKACIASGDQVLPAFSRHLSHVVNYNDGLKNNHVYSQKIYFKLPGDSARHWDNHFEVTFRGDFIGSHITDISVSLSGIKHNLLNDHNDSHEVQRDKVGISESINLGGHTYTFYANAQGDHLTDQGIDSIYLAIDHKPALMSSKNDNEITIITYNIQAFPNYIGADLDLNKMDSRIAYLGRSETLRSADLVVFEEAWDRGSREKLIHAMKSDYPYVIDPLPENTHFKPLNSGLLVLSRHPIKSELFINYQDYQTLADADNLSNKGAIYFKMVKNGLPYHIIATHTQAESDAHARENRQQEFHLIKQHIVDNALLAIPVTDPLLLVGDLNTDFYDKEQFGYMDSVLALNTDVVLHNLASTPRFSFDSAINLMIDSNHDEQGLYDFVLPFKGYLQPTEAMSQITPLRALDENKMYQRSHNMKLYHYGDVELSDHFMVQAKFTFPDRFQCEYCDTDSRVE